MHVLVIGAPCTGKSHDVKALRARGINALDMDSISSFFDSRGRPATYNPDGGEKWWRHHYYVIDLSRLKGMLRQHRNFYLFAWNVSTKVGDRNGLKELIPLFDKVYYLYAPAALLRYRLVNRGEKTFGHHPDEFNAVLTEKVKSDRRARREGWHIIDARLSPKEIFEIIRK